MVERIATAGDAEDLALAGNGSDEGDYVVRFGEEGQPADVVWLERAPADGFDAPRVIAPGGSGLWRRAPWPVNDDVFDLRPPGGPAVLLVGPPDAADEVAEYLGETERAERLTRSALEQAGIVVFAQAEDDPLPAPAFAVLAARRVLVVREPVSFGLEPGVNHLSAETAAGTSELATSAVLHWEAFHSLRTFGRIAAEPHRASSVYARLAFDLAAETAG